MSDEEKEKEESDSSEYESGSEESSTEESGDGGSETGSSESGSSYESESESDESGEAGSGEAGAGSPPMAAPAPSDALAAPGAPVPVEDARRLWERPWTLDELRESILSDDWTLASDAGVRPLLLLFLCFWLMHHFYSRFEEFLFF